MILTLEKARADNWTKRKFFEGTSAKIGPSIDHTGFPVTGLSATEEKKFEKELRLPTGSLARNSDYWNDFVIVVDGGRTKLDESMPEDQMKIKFLKAQSLIAFGSEELLTNSKAEYILYSEESEKVSKNKVRREKNRALKLVASLDPSELKGMVYLYGHNPKSMSEDAVEDFIYEKVEESPSTFMLISADPEKESKVFVHTLVKSGIIEVRAGAFLYNKETLAYGLDATAHLLAKKSNQELRIAMEKQLVEK